MTDGELRLLATDIVEGRVIGSWMIPDEKIPVVFRPLATGGAEKLPDDASCLYEYINKSSVKSIDGYPMFSSMRFLTQSDRQRLTSLIEQYKQLKRDFLDG